MKVEYFKPGDLIPYENNAKIHPLEQVEHIANSIKQFGFQQPIVVDKNMVVIIGHGRLQAAKELLLDTVPVVIADNLTEEQVNALRLADNKLNESPWDFGRLEEELAALSIAGMDMESFGFRELEEQLDESPEGFKEFGEETETAHKCPRCGYEWN
jgi:site-specific DNA-methyltransferase (adenine-specific)